MKSLAEHILFLISVANTLLLYRRDLTAINASSEEVSSWVESWNHENALDNASGAARFLESQEATSSGKSSSVSLPSKGGPPARCSKKENFSFICECFFMTARVLNMGLMKAVADFKHLSQVWRCCFHSSHLFLFM